jgi:hypothetical protein
VRVRGKRPFSRGGGAEEICMASTVGKSVTGSKRDAVLLAHVQD